MSERRLVTADVAVRLGMTRNGLNAYLFRNPEVRPAERFTDGRLAWTEEDIAAIIVRRANRTRRSKVPKTE